MGQPDLGSETHISNIRPTHIRGPIESRKSAIGYVGPGVQRTPRGWQSSLISHPRACREMGEGLEPRAHGQRTWASVPRAIFRDLREKAHLRSTASMQLAGPHIAAGLRRFVLIEERTLASSEPVCDNRRPQRSARRTAKSCTAAI